MPKKSDATARRPRVAPFAIGEVEVAPGRRGRTAIPAARLPTGDWLSLDVDVVHGKAPGPAVWLSGAIHGDELDGVEITRRVLDVLDARTLRGTVVGVPIVNLFGVVNESRYLPDRRDLNRSFPGSLRGSLAGRMAHLFMQEVVERCDVGIDYHCGSDDRENLPQVRANLDDPETRRLALAFGAPVAIHNRPPDGSLRKAAVKRGASVILYEAGEAYRFTPPAIEAGVRGTLRVLAALGMRDFDDDATAETLESRRTVWLRAGRSGICRLDVTLGDAVRKGQVVGRITDVLGSGGVRVTARTGGLVVGRRVHPLVYQGEAVLHIAERDDGRRQT